MQDQDTLLMADHEFAQHADPKKPQVCVKCHFPPDAHPGYQAREKSAVEHRTQVLEAKAREKSAIEHARLREEIDRHLGKDDGDTDPGRPASMRETPRDNLFEWFRLNAIPDSDDVAFENRVRSFEEWVRNDEKAKRFTEATAVLEERQKEHGDPVPNMKRFAELLEAYFGWEFTLHDAAIIQILFKISRIAANINHMDNYRDVEGYVEIARRCL